jgi:hypothetical protein
MLVKSGAKRGEECRARLGWWGRMWNVPLILWWACLSVAG